MSFCPAYSHAKGLAEIAGEIGGRCKTTDSLILCRHCWSIHFVHRNVSFYKISCIKADLWYWSDSIIHHLTDHWLVTKRRQMVYRRLWCWGCDKLSIHLRNYVMEEALLEGGLVLKTATRRVFIKQNIVDFNNPLVYVHW